jgi:hypothetical protein
MSVTYFPRRIKSTQREVINVGSLYLNNRRKNNMRDLDGDSIKKVSRKMKKLFGSKEDKLAKAVDQLSSIQACKDASLTGNEDTQILAICRLGDFGIESLETLDIALFDDSSKVRAAAAGVIVYLADKKGLAILEPHKNDASESVRDIVEYGIRWLEKRGKETFDDREIELGKIAEPLVVLDEALPLRTSDMLEVSYEYTIETYNLNFRVMLRNETGLSISDVDTTLLAYPTDSLELSVDRSKVLVDIEAAKTAVVEYDFELVSDCIEGEFITSVLFTDNLGDRMSARAGNFFICSVFEQLQPFELTEDEFSEMRHQFKNWNREHTIESRASKLYEFIQSMMEKKNLHIFKKESSKQKKVFMGVIAGMGIGRLQGSYVSAMLTVVGPPKEKVSKLRIDIHSDNPELLHAAASSLFEEIITLT